MLESDALLDGFDELNARTERLHTIHRILAVARTRRAVMKERKEGTIVGRERST
jgi:hypothetical protein